MRPEDYVKETFYYTESGSGPRIAVKRTVVLVGGVMLPQHVHTYSHLSMLAAGAVRVWAGEKLLGDYYAPAGIEISAGVQHKFLVLVPGTAIDCIHVTDADGNILSREAA